PYLWVVLRPTGGDPPFSVVTVTADPTEGEAFTETGTDLVEPLPMPEPIAKTVSAFVAEHHVERTFEKRKRDRADPESLGRRRGEDAGGARRFSPAGRVASAKPPPLPRRGRVARTAGRSRVGGLCKPLRRLAKKEKRPPTPPRRASRGGRGA